MSERSTDSDSAASALAEGFAAQVGRWARSRSASADARAAAVSAARQLSLAVSDGQVCVMLGELQDPDGRGLDSTSWRTLLRASGVVGTPSDRGSMPLIVDDQQRLYLHRYFDLENRLAARLYRATQAPPREIDDAAAARLNSLFPATDGLVDRQKLAAALALRQRLVVISGGPGTGKTTTLVQLLACLLEQDPRCRIMLAAPTGKAATRMREALHERARHLPEGLRQALPAESFTVHRLLGVRPGGFVHHAGRPLALDVLVVDEAAMLDLSLATQLLEAVPDGARIILLGDKDQLAAVEAGAVFAELSSDPSLGADCIADLARACGVAAQHIATPAAGPGLQDSTVWLRRNYRFEADSGIGRLAEATQRGDLPALRRLLHEGRDDLQWIADGETAPGRASRDAMLQGFAPYLDVLQRDPQDHAAALAAFARFRVLCALRKGPRGVEAVNAWLLQQLLPGAAGPVATQPGRPVMVLRNEPLLGLFNGDLGLMLPGPDGRLGAVFPAAEGLPPRWLPALRLPEHQTAFAMTVHKSQGSEFDTLLLLLPAQRSRVLGRELLYTAVTRARQRVTLAAPAEVLAAAVDSPTRRHSGLLARLHESRAAAGFQ